MHHLAALRDEWGSLSRFPLVHPWERILQHCTTTKWNALLPWINHGFLMVWTFLGTFLDNASAQLNFMTFASYREAMIGHFASRCEEKKLSLSSSILTVSLTGPAQWPNTLLQRFMLVYPVIVSPISDMADAPVLQPHHPEYAIGCVSCIELSLSHFTPRRFAVHTSLSCNFYRCHTGWAPAQHNS